MPICPNKECGSDKSKVLNTRAVRSALIGKRYRVCKICGTRYTTEERVIHITKLNNELCRT